MHSTTLLQPLPTKIKVSAPTFSATLACLSTKSSDKCKNLLVGENLDHEPVPPAVEQVLLPDLVAAGDVGGDQEQEEGDR